MAGQAHGFVEPGGVGGRVERDQDFGPVVFFDAELDAARGPALDEDGRHSRHPAARGGETAGERAVISGLAWLAFDLLPVAVPEDHRDRFSLEHGVIVSLWIHREADALVLDRLARAIEGAVGEQDGLVAGTGFLPAREAEYPHIV